MRSLWLLLAWPFPLVAQRPVTDSVVAFVGVNVVTMTSPDVARNQTVIVRNGVIASVAPTDRANVPAGARQIPAGGRYLMPGLADFHVHLGERADLGLYLASGVTTVAHMGGNGQRVLAWRDSVRAGQIVGPTIYAGYYVNGPQAVGGVQTVTTTADAIEGVADASRRHFDFIKVYNSLTEEQYLAIMAAARQRGLPVLGHAVRSIGIERGFGLGQVAIVHAEEYTYVDDMRRAGRVDETLMPKAVAFTKRADASLVPNLSAFAAITRQWGKPAVIDTFLAQPEAAYLSDLWRGRWRSADYVTRTGTIDALPILMRLTLAMQKGGVRLLLGTDSPGIPGLFPGASLHEDLRLMERAGLTRYEALLAGTRNAGEFAAKHFKSAPAGTIVPGHRADLVLLAGNPLDDLNVARTPLGVMVGGRWLTASDLASLRRAARP
jgi:imidazolonepropionase-like amidohydrolase